MNNEHAYTEESGIREAVLSDFKPPAPLPFRWSDVFPARAWLKARHPNLMTYWLRRWLVPGLSPTPQEEAECIRIRDEMLALVSGMLESRSGAVQPSSHQTSVH